METLISIGLLVAMATFLAGAVHFVYLIAKNEWDHRHNVDNSEYHGR